MIFSNYSIFYRDIEHHGIEYALRHSAELGYQAVEFLDILPCDQPIHIRLDSALCKDLLSQYGLTVSCYSICADLFSDDWLSAESDMLAAVDFAASVGSPYFHHTLFPSYVRDASSAPYEAILQEALPLAIRIAERCASHGMTCLYEPQGAYFNGVEGLDVLLHEMRQRGLPVGICGDTGNSLFVGVSPEDIFAHFAADIRHVHVKDYLLTQTPIAGKESVGTCGETYLYGCDLGEGAVDFARLFQLLRQAGYTGNISFETGKDDETAKKDIAWIRELCVQAGLL